MIYLAGKMDSRGPMIDVKIMQSPQQVASLKNQGYPSSSPQVVTGLLDTGASCSCMDKHMIQALNLELTGVVDIHTPSTRGIAETRETYEATVVIAEKTARPWTLTLQVVSSDFSAQGFGIVIGRDILRHSIFRFEGPADRFELFL